MYFTLDRRPVHLLCQDPKSVVCPFALSSILKMVFLRQSTICLARRADGAVEAR